MSEVKQNETIKELKSFTNSNGDTESHYRIYLDDDIGHARIYRDIYNKLGLLTENDKVEIIINTYGGYFYSCKQLHDAISECKAQTTAVLYTGYSCGANLTMSCDKVVITDESDMLIHNGSMWEHGKPNDVLVHAKHHYKFVESYFNKIYKDFLTKKEIKEVMDGRELWLDSTEIKRRLKIINK